MPQLHTLRRLLNLFTFPFHILPPLRPWLLLRSSLPRHTCPCCLLLQLFPYPHLSPPDSDIFSLHTSPRLSSPAAAPPYVSTHSTPPLLPYLSPFTSVVSCYPFPIPLHNCHRLLPHTCHSFLLHTLLRLPLTFVEADDITRVIHLHSASELTHGGMQSGIPHPE